MLEMALAVEKVDHHDAGLNSVEKTAATTTGVNGEDVVHIDKPNVSNASEEADDDSIDSCHPPLCTSPQRLHSKCRSACRHFLSSFIIISPTRPRWLRD